MHHASAYRVLDATETRYDKDVQQLRGRGLPEASARALAGMFPPDSQVPSFRDPLLEPDVLAERLPQTSHDWRELFGTEKYNLMIDVTMFLAKSVVHILNLDHQFTLNNESSQGSSTTAWVLEKYRASWVALPAVRRTARICGLNTCTAASSQL